MIQRYTFGYVDVEDNGEQSQELQLIPARFGEAVKHADHLREVGEERIKSRLLGHEDRDAEVERLRGLLREWRAEAKVAHDCDGPEWCDLCKRTDAELGEK